MRELVATPTHPSAATVYGLAWSPQGRYLAVAGEGVEVYRWKRDDEWNKEWGLLLTQYTGHAGKVYAVAWSQSGRQLASFEL